MNWILAVVALLLLTLSNANYHDLQHRSGDDVLHKLTSGNHDIYLMLFYHPNEGHQHLKSTNNHLAERLQEQFLQKNDIKDLYYAALDCTNPAYKGLMEKLELDTDDLINSPALVLMEHGNGFIMTGPRTISEMKQNLNELLDNRDQGF